jgi:hypothetical protein
MKTVIEILDAKIEYFLELAEDAEDRCLFNDRQYYRNKADTLDSFRLTLIIEEPTEVGLFDKID